MKAVVQRVSSAKVEVEEKIAGEIDRGFLVLLGVENGDTGDMCEYLAKKVSGLRIFEDENGKMNLSLADVGGKILAISNFTLCADCKKGYRPSFVNAAPPKEANGLYEYFCECCREHGIAVETGIFRADMKVSLLNDGPVTIILDTKELRG